MWTGLQSVNNQCPACNLQLSTRQCLKRHWSHWQKRIGKDRLDEYLTDFDAQGKDHVSYLFKEIQQIKYIARSSGKCSWRNWTKARIMFLLSIS